jgi:glucosylceramidase
MPLGLARLVSPRQSSGPGAASADAAGTTYTAIGLKAGSAAVLYGNGTQIATATVDGTGKATWTLGSKPAAGTIITYDGVVVGSGGTVPAPVSALGPTTASFAAGSTTPIPITGLNSGETVASVTGSFTVSGNSIVPSAGLVAGSYSPVVTTSTGRTLTIAVTANAGAGAASAISRVAMPASGSVATAPTTDSSAPSFSTLAAPTTRQIVVDPTTELQTFQGVGVQLQDATRYNFDTFAPGKMAAEFGKFFGENQGGVSLIRAYVGSGAFIHQRRASDGGADYYTPTGPLADFTPQDTTLPGFNMARWVEEYGVVMKLAAQQNPNVRSFISCATPPAWMKKNGPGDGTNATPGPIRTADASNPYNKDGQGFVAPGTAGLFDMAFAQHYANMLIRAYQYIIAYGVPIYAVAVQNEPEVGGSYPTCQWNPADHTTFTRDFLRPALNAAGLSYIEIWTGECNQDATSAFVTPLLADAAAKAAVQAVAFHSYGGTPAQASAIRDTHPTIRLHMTEWRTLLSSPQTNAHVDLWNLFCGGFRGGSLADRLGYNSMSMFVFALSQSGNPTTNNAGRRGVITINDTTGAITYNPEYHMLTLFGRNVKVGAKRISSSSFSFGSTSDVLSCAFKNPDGSIALFLFNGSTTASKTASVIDAVTGKAAPLTLAAGEAAVMTYPGSAAGTKALALSGVSAVTNASNQADVAWTLPSDANRTGVVVLRASGSDTPIPIAVLPANATSFTDASVTNGLAYDYYVQALGNGRSALSAKASVTIGGTAPPPAGQIGLKTAKPVYYNVPNTLILSGKTDGSTVSIATNDGQVLTTTTKYAAWTPLTEGAVSATPTETRLDGSSTVSNPVSFQVISAGITAGQIRIRDTFTNPTPGTPQFLENHTAEVGRPWLQKTGVSGTRQMAIGDNGVLYGLSTSAIHYSSQVYKDGVATPFSTEAFRVDALIFAAGDNTINNQTGFILSTFSPTANVNGYTVNYDNGTGVWSFYRVANGTRIATDLIPAITKPIPVGQAMPVTAIRNHATGLLAFQLDGETVGSITDTNVNPISYIETRHNTRSTTPTTGAGLTEIQVSVAA